MVGMPSTTIEKNSEYSLQIRRGVGVESTDFQNVPTRCSSITKQTVIVDAMK